MISLMELQQQKVQLEKDIESLHGVGGLSYSPVERELIEELHAVELKIASWGTRTDSVYRIV